MMKTKGPRDANDVKRAVCLQHVPFEGPGVFARLLAGRGYELRTSLVPTQGLPDDPGELLLVMGGPMSVNDLAPWIREEIEFLRKSIQSGIPILGVCLGSQLLARALWAQVRPGHQPEIGMTQIRLTREGSKDPVFGTMPDSFEVFQWHGDAFDLPPGSVILASSDLFPMQAFRYRDRIYGLLFHLEMGRPDIEALCRECPGDLARANVDAATVLRRADESLPQLNCWAARLIDHLVGAPR